MSRPRTGRAKVRVQVLIPREVYRIAKVMHLLDTDLTLSGILEKMIVQGARPVASDWMRQRQAASLPVVLPADTPVLTPYGEDIGLS